MIEIDAVSKRFGEHQAVDRVSLRIQGGEIFGIIGPNGAGKTTLFRMICQILRPDSGRIVVNSATNELGIKAQIGYLPEEHRLYEQMLTLDYLKFFAELLGVHRTRAHSVLESVGLMEKQKAKISSLSKGMRQKLAFARTLLSDPPVLILDEPTYGLDPRTSQEMRGWIRREAAEKTVLLSSHNLHEAERVCGHVAILHRGKVAALGSPRALIEELKTEHLLAIDFSGSDLPLRRALEPLPVLRPPVFEATRVKVAFDKTLSPYELLQHVLSAIEREKEPVVITGIAPQDPTLEDVFLKVTGEVFQDADTTGKADRAQEEPLEEAPSAADEGEAP